MPGGQFGDLVVEMGIDDRKWVEGALRVQNSSKGLATNIQTNMNQASGAMGRGVGQLGFAIQDFSSIMSMGGRGAMERALMSTMNNVQMLGASFGPWGLAITAVGGALGSLLLPKLLEGVDETEKFTAAVKENAEALKVQVKAAGEAIDFREKLTDLSTGTPAGLDKALRENSVSAEKVEAERKLVERDLSTAIIRAQQMGAIANNTPGGLGILMDRNRINPDARFSVNSDVVGEEGAKHLSEMWKRWVSLTNAGKLFSDRREEIGGLDQSVGDAERKRRNEKELAQDEASAERIRREALSPLDIAKEKLAEIQRLQASGQFGADTETAVRAAERVVSDFKLPQSRSVNQAVSGGEFGTASGFAEVMKSIRQSTSSPELEAQKAIKAELEKLVAAFKSGLKLNPPIQQRGI